MDEKKKKYRTGKGGRTKRNEEEGRRKEEYLTVHQTYYQDTPLVVIYRT